MLAKGWGYAILIPAAFRPITARASRRASSACEQGPAPQARRLGHLRAWAWGASRALDYFETDKAVDAKQVGIEGLSRYGKAAIVTMAYDQRFAIGFIGSSGEGGAKPHRRNYGEMVENVAEAGEYHWMAGNFIKYAGPLTGTICRWTRTNWSPCVRPAPCLSVRGRSRWRAVGWTPRGMFMAAADARVRCTNCWVKRIWAPRLSRHKKQRYWTVKSPSASTPAAIRPARTGPRS